MNNLVYILAASHSGSTLLSMLLGSHPQIANAGELKLSAIGNLDTYRCSCGNLILNCEFWDKVKKGMEARGFDFDLSCAGTDYRYIESAYVKRLLSSMHRGLWAEKLRDTALYLSPTWREQLPRVHKRNAALISTIAEIKNAKIVTDSSKIGLRLKYLLKNPDLNVKIVRLIRDGRAVALTYMDTKVYADSSNPSLRAGGSGEDSKNNDKNVTIDQASREWKRCNEEAKSILQNIDKNQYFEVNYENLCENTDNILDSIFNFLDLDPDKRAKNFRSVEQHVVGNGMRLDTSSEVKLDERWKSVLTKEQLRIFDEIAGTMNHSLGYK